MTSDPNSKIVPVPSHIESRLLIMIYNSTKLEYSHEGRLTGFNYQALKDNVKWANLSQKKYVPVILKCMDLYLNGSNS